MDEPKIEDALKFMNEIKERFKDDEPRYKDFLSIMIELKNQGIGDGSTIQKVKMLFEGHNDLLQKFIAFLPPDCGVDLTRAFGAPQLPQQLQNQYIPAMADSRSEQQVATQYVSMIKERFANDNNMTYNRFMTILQEYQTGAKDMSEVVKDIVTLFHGHQDLINAFVRFLPPEYQVTVFNQLSQQQQQQQQIQYRMPIATERPAYPIYTTTQKKPRSTRQQRTQPSTAQPVAPQPAPTQHTAPVTRSRRRYTEEEPEVEPDTIPANERRFFDRVKREIPSEVIYHQFLQLLDLYNKDILPLNELFSALTDLLHLRHPVLAQLRGYLSNKGISEEVMSHNQTLLTWDQIHSFEGPTPSYHALPPQIPRRVGSQRSYADSLVLNDNLVSQTIGSEDFSYSHMRRNQYEEALFRCEDDRFEADVILETTHSAIAQLELLQHEMEELEDGEEANYRLRDDSLSAVQIGAIRRVYGHNGIDKEIIKLLFINPKGCIPRVLERLRAKEKEWIEEKVALNERCREIQKQNYYLSLDHRSFYFRQQDKKDITTKVLVDTIKDIASKRYVKKEDGEEQHRFDEGEGHISVQLTDHSIHKQVIRLLLVTAKKQFTKSEMKRFKTVISELVISFFNLTPNFIDSAEIENSGVQYVEGTAVSTPNGEGVIQSYNSSTKLYSVAVGDNVVELPRHSILIIQPTTESGSEEEENEGEMSEELPAVKEEEIENPEEEVPIQVEVDEPVLPENKEMVFGGNTVYVFYRLYCLLYTRLQKSRDLCATDLYTEQNMTAHVVERAVDDQKDSNSTPTACERFVDLMDTIIQLLRGELTNQLFEQHCRQILGTSGYFLYTLDRVVIGCIRQIQSILNEKVSLEVVSLHNYLKQQGGIRPTLYLHNTLRLIGDSRVNLFRMQYTENGEKANDMIDGVMEFWYVGCVHDLERPAGTLSDAFYKYANEYIQHLAIETSVDDQVIDASSPFLTRSKAKALNEREDKAEMDEKDEFIPDQYDGELVNKGGRKRKTTLNDEDSPSSKKVKLYFC